MAAPGRQACPGGRARPGARRRGPACPRGGGAPGAAGVPRGPRPAWAPAPVADLHAGGAVMWIGGDAIMFGLMMLIYLMWSLDERDMASGHGWLERVRKASMASLVAAHQPAADGPARPAPGAGGGGAGGG